MLGFDTMWLFLHNIIIVDVNTRLFDTTFGHMIAFQQRQPYHTPPDSDIYRVFATFSFEKTVENLWLLEAIGITCKNLSEYQLELAALDDFYKNIEEIEGRYRIKWPYRFWPPPPTPTQYKNGTSIS